MDFPDHDPVLDLILVAGLLVGTLLGVMLDRWLGTAPLFLLLGIGIGFAAGLRNLARSLQQQDDGDTPQSAASPRESTEDQND